MTAVITKLAKWALGLRQTASYRRESKGKVVNAGSEKILVLDLDENPYARYLYAFVKFFIIAGYEVRLVASPSILYSIQKAQYGNLILKEKLVRLYSSGTNPEGSLSLGKEGSEVQLVPSDFQARDENESVVYDVPMAQHPLMYSEGYWCEALPEKARPAHAILFMGNCEGELYREISRQGLFRVMDRIRIREVLCEDERYLEVRDDAILQNPVEGKIHFVDSQHLSVDLKDFRSVLAKYRCFLCAPGVFMPLCHNLIESMSVGAIPIIQDEYARMMQPALEHGQNAFIFHGEEDLKNVVEACLSSSTEALKTMSESVKKYYDSYLTPEAVVTQMTRPGISKVRMLAGKHGLALLRKSRGL